MKRAAVKPAIFVLALLGLSALGLAAYSLGMLMRGSPELHGTEIEEPPSVGDVTLLAVDGEEVRLGDFAGDYLLVFFGYTNCPDVCPLTMSRLAGIYRNLGEPEGLEVVMVTVDPERDTPEVVDSFVRRFHPDFTGLSGSQEMIDAAASRFYISHRLVDDGVVHGGQVLLVNEGSRYWRVYNDDAQLALEADLRQLLAGSGV